METRDSRIHILQQVMDAAALRHRVIAQNVANVNTPGYRRQEVVFEDEMARAFAGASSPTAVNVKPYVVTADGPERVDGNTVDLNREMNDLNKNFLLYEAAAQIITSRVTSLKTAIAGH